ncbi:MAG: integration host factor subunit beta [Rhodospirillales bacterium]|nr:integration host factor subunit beta [Acetobacter sp.]
MIRSALITRIAEQNPHLYAKDVEAVVSVILNTVTEALARGDRVELRDFGAFSINELQGRTARNPRTGAIVEVVAKRTIAFKPGKAMRARLNREQVGPEK